MLIRMAAATIRRSTFDSSQSSERVFHGHRTTDRIADLQLPCPHRFSLFARYFRQHRNETVQNTVLPTQSEPGRRARPGRPRKTHPDAGGDAAKGRRRGGERSGGGVRDAPEDGRGGSPSASRGRAGRPSVPRGPAISSARGVFDRSVGWSGAPRKSCVATAHYDTTPLRSRHRQRGVGLHFFFVELETKPCCGVGMDVAVRPFQAPPSVLVHVAVY